MANRRCRTPGCQEQRAIPDTELLESIAAINTGLSRDAIEHLDDLQWVTLAGLISTWIDNNADHPVLQERHYLPRPELIGCVISLVVTGHLKLEVALPEEVLTEARLTEAARFDIRISLPQSPPNAAVGGDVNEIIFSKLDLFAHAVARLADLPQTR